jgi:23S rRNA (cytosine1962-C5)-methyltransferase
LRLLKTLSPISAAYHKILSRQVGRATATEASSRLLFGKPATESFVVRENGIAFELSFAEGYSVGLFLDQRDNRRRLLTGHIAAEFTLASDSNTLAQRREMLNLFAYTCGFSVCAARNGYTTISVDLSKKYLEWGRRNFVLNGIDPAAHEFVYGDAFEWLQRFGKKNRRFDIVVLDPPTFSRSKQTGPFRAEKDYGRLVSAALRVLKAGGVLLASSNAARWPAEQFVPVIEIAVRQAGRRIVQKYYAPQPPDFPVSPSEPAYLKTLWLKVD